MLIVGTTSRTKMSQIGDKLNKKIGRSMKKKRIKRNVCLVSRGRDREKGISNSVGSHSVAQTTQP